MRTLGGQGVRCWVKAMRDFGRAQSCKTVEAHNPTADRQLRKPRQVWGYGDPEDLILHKGNYTGLEGHHQGHRLSTATCQEKLKNHIFM